MNTRIKCAIAGVGTLAAVGLGIAPAMASSGPGTVTAVTHTQNHPDTTSVANSCAPISANGPVWAYDNLSLRFTAVPDGTGTYSVTITAHGSFSQVASPTTGACETGAGSVDGWLNYEVSSSTPPDPANLPAQQASGDTGQGTMLNELFGGNATITGGGHYNYTYNPVDGARYTQSG
jgi:hypothetical protein